MEGDRGKERERRKGELECMEDGGRGGEKWERGGGEKREGGGGIK